MSLEISDRQRDRLDRIKAECTDDHLPEPTDAQILDSLLDTWDAVEKGLYSGGAAESGKAAELKINGVRLGVYVTQEAVDA